MATDVVDQQADLLVADAKSRWRSGEDFDTRAFLAEHPEITARKSLLLDIAYEDFCQHVDDTDDEAIAAFLGRFPSLRSSLRKQIDVHKFLAAHKDMLAADGPADWPLPGETIFDFTVLEELGRGTFARVYLCTQSGLGDRQVVVKLGLEGDYEADVLGKLSDNNIMPVHSVERDEVTGMSAICMPFRGRSTLCDVLDLAFERDACPTSSKPILTAAARWTRDGEWDQTNRQPHCKLQRMNYVDAILHTTIHLADGLQHAHDQGILHGDLKPSNVLVTPSGTPLILDFNLSWQQHTRTTAPGGTLPYMSPEQIQSTILDLDDEPAVVDVRADVFSLGVMLYELLCGRLPFQPAGGLSSVGASALQLIEAHRSGPRPLDKLNRHVGKRVAACVARCLQVDPADRPASMAELAAELRRCLTPTRRLNRWLQVYPRWATALAVFVVAASIGLAAYFVARPPYHMRRVHVGVDALQRGDLPAAITHFDEAIAAKPDFAEAYFVRGRIRLRLKNYVAAQRDFEAAYRFRPSGQYAAGYALCLTRLGYHKEALMLYSDALNRGKSDVVVYNNFAYSCAMMQTDLRHARELLDQGITLDPAPYQLYLNRALLEMAQAQFNQAELSQSACDDIDLAVERAPRNGELSFLAARIHALRSRHDPGQVGSALDHLADACERGIRASKKSVSQQPDLDVLHDHPRFRSLISGKIAASTDPLPDRILDPPLISHDQAQLIYRD